MRHGAQSDPANRFLAVHAEPDDAHWEWDPQDRPDPAQRSVEYLIDEAQSIVSENQSPDIPFRYSLNPYRGCSHGCAYCYARNTHEYLGLSAGIDFETKIFVKPSAARLFRDFLARPSWVPEEVAFSGVTDCYQPAERRYRLTRACLEVALACRQPVGIVTKNALVVRDLDLLREMAALRLVHVHVSVTTLDAELARVMEPGTSIPSARLRAIELLSAAGVPTRVMVAPIIPGLNDAEIPAILAAAAAAGARDAAYILLRLPLTVAPVFQEWLSRTQPLKAAKIEGLIRTTRDGALSQSAWGERMRGNGPFAEQVRQLFRVCVQKSGLNQPLPPHDFSRFQPPADGSGQLLLF
jgi:DNA repair photolyase